MAICADHLRNAHKLGGEIRRKCKLKNNEVRRKIAKYQIRLGLSVSDSIAFRENKLALSRPVACPSGHFWDWERYELVAYTSFNMTTKILPGSVNWWNLGFINRHCLPSWCHCRVLCWAYTTSTISTNVQDALMYGALKLVPPKITIVLAAGKDTLSEIAR